MNDAVANEKSGSTDDTINKENKADKTKNSIIYTLSTLIVILLVYILATAFINNKNKQIVHENDPGNINDTSEFSTEIHDRININTDNIFELMQLPGIGTGKAEAIIEYRKENGNFNTTDELLNVSGIGQTTFDKIKDFIYCE